MFRCTEGQPWRCLSLSKHLSSDSIAVEEEETFIAYKADCEDNVSNREAEDLVNTVITSTPQKTSDEMIKVKIDNNLIGQGDEEIDTPENEFNNSTAIFINNLFDMSDVERVIVTEDNELISTEPCNFPPLQDITKMMESYVNAALSMAFVTETHEAVHIPRDSSRSTDYSGYSFLSDAFDMEDIGEEVTFMINNGIADVEATEVVPVGKIIEVQGMQQEDTINNNDGSEFMEKTHKNDTALYESTYLTLNRDYDQNSEEEGPVLLDPKGLTMQEVELITAHTSDDDLAFKPEKKSHEMAATSAVSGTSRKSLVHRCRSQGARLLSCIRGWWRRKTPGKRKESRVSGSIRGLCPLSPDARLRANSMLEQRRVHSPSPNRSVVWKFNTVNEALVNSSRWKEYTFNVKPDECGEY
ncbi:uncharacterized protein LOC128672739 isoform X2 [Plodia interpunctella]|uniref:uncharacterized protein LOC128672739 isoform X2 n=1 Tax=Plodia interpunctella TaxID=58824 RepID=UPI002367EA45|nr:uncharacterized protein LOC128672739 isoform X2 [Plodia interpunctella]XP_053606060.1 uncharacterized protein LOC128672739 isoform X2 [Plodia interpunctella]